MGKRKMDEKKAIDQSIAWTNEDPRRQQQPKIKVLKRESLKHPLISDETLERLLTTMKKK